MNQYRLKTIPVIQRKFIDTIHLLYQSPSPKEMEGLKNEHYFGGSNQTNEKAESSFARDAYDSMNLGGGFSSNNRNINQNMQNLQNSSLRGIPGFPNFPQMQGMQSLIDNGDMMDKANVFNMNFNMNAKDQQGRGQAQNAQRTQNNQGYPSMPNMPNNFPMGAGVANRQAGGQGKQTSLNTPSVQGLPEMPNVAGLPQFSGFDPQSQSVVPPEEHNYNYYQEFCRLYIANVVLNTQMNELVQEKNELLTKMAQLEKKSEELQRSQNSLYPLEEKKKRFRRVASEIERHYRCPIETCQKSYGSEGSLNQHLKIKHPEYQIPPSLNKEEGSEEAGSPSKGE